MLIVIPAYQEAGTVGDIVSRCLRFGPVLVVDDGSTDETAAAAAAAGAEVIQTGRNAGKGAALMRGLGVAVARGHALAVTMDADGQHRPEDLPRLLARARGAGGAIVIGSRRAARAGMPAARRRANAVADFWVSWASGARIADSQSGFRVYPTAVLRRLDPARLGQAGFAFESAVLIEAGRIGCGTVAVDIPAIYGGSLRRSHFRPVRDIARITVMVGGTLLRRGMHPRGLWRVMRGTR